MSPTVPDEALTVLQEGKIALRGEFMWGSNYTYLALVKHGGKELATVYKPTKGVRQLWDFSSPSLARREVAERWMAGIGQRRGERRVHVPRSARGIPEVERRSDRQEAQVVLLEHQDRISRRAEGDRALAESDVLGARQVSLEEELPIELG